MTAKAYILPETAITFQASGGTVLFTPTSLAAGAGHQSAQHDFGASARVFMFDARAYCKFTTTPIVGEVIDVYLKTSDGTHIDNDDGTTDAAVSAEEKLRNLTWIGSIMVDEASTTVKFVMSTPVSIRARYVQVVFWNRTVDAVSATAADNGFVLNPTTMQAQDT